MGKTNPPTRVQIEDFQDRYSTFERALRRPRDEHYRQTMAHVLKVSSAIHAQNPFDRMGREMLYLIAICTRQQEAIAELEERLDEIEP